MNEDYQLNLEVNKAQARLLASVLELYVRMGLGQYEEISDQLNYLHTKEGELPPGPFSDNVVRKTMLQLKREHLGYSESASYGIGSPEVHKDAKVAYDLMKVLQKAIATKEEHASFSVWHDGPILHMGPEPVAKVTVEE